MMQAEMDTTGEDIDIDYPWMLFAWDRSHVVYSQFQLAPESLSLVSENEPTAHDTKQRINNYQIGTVPKLFQICNNWTSW
jgi:hypothetical protein